MSSGPDRPQRRPLPGDEDPLLPPLSVLRRHGARILDPFDAVLLPGQELRPTAYIAKWLLAPAAFVDNEEELLQRAAASVGLRADTRVDDKPSGAPRELTGVRIRLDP